MPIEDRRGGLFYPFAPEYPYTSYDHPSIRWSGLADHYEHVRANPNLYSEEEVRWAFEEMWRERQARGIEQSQRLGLSAPDQPPRLPRETVYRTRRTFPGLVRELPDQDRSPSTAAALDYSMKRLSGGGAGGEGETIPSEPAENPWLRLTGRSESESPPENPWRRLAQPADYSSLWEERRREGEEQAARLDLPDPGEEPPGILSSAARLTGASIVAQVKGLPNVASDLLLATASPPGTRLRRAPGEAGDVIPGATEAARKHEAARDRLAEAAVDLPTPLAVGVHQLSEMAAIGLDPLEALPGGLAARGVAGGGRAVRRALDFSDLGEAAARGLGEGAGAAARETGAQVGGAITDALKAESDAILARHLSREVRMVEDSARALVDESLPPNIQAAIDSGRKRMHDLQRQAAKLKAEGRAGEAHRALAEVSQVRDHLGQLAARGRAQVEARHAEARAGLRMAGPEAMAQSPELGRLLRERLGMAEGEGARAAGAAGAGAVDTSIDDLASVSQSLAASPPAVRRVARVAIEPTPKASAIRELTAYDGEGNRVGSMTFSLEFGGFRVQDVETGVRGSGGLREMMRKAKEMAKGPYLGSMAETDEGAGALSRLRETDPDLFPQTATERKLGILAQAGGKLDPDAAAPARSLGAMAAPPSGPPRPPRPPRRPPASSSPPSPPGSSIPRSQAAGPSVVDVATSSTLPELRAAPKGVQRAVDWVRDRFESFGQFGSPSRRFVDPEARAFVRSVLPRRIARQADEERAIVQQMQRVRTRLDRGIKDTAARTGQSPAALRREVNAARLAGDLGRLDAIDPTLRPLAQEAGDFIDTLSRRLIDQGVVDEARAETIAANLGRYLHTSHAAFDVRNFKDVALKDRARYDAAFRYLQREMPEATDEEVVGVLYQLVDRDTGKVPFRFGGALPSKDLRVLMERGDIPDELRQLMGVHEDFVVNFEKTGALLAHDLTVHQMLQDVAEEGKRLGVFQDQPRGELYRPIPGREGKSPLANLTTTPEVAQLLSASAPASRAGLYVLANGLVKWGKVGLSPQTQVRNWESGFLMTLAQGRFIPNFRAFKDAASTALATVSGGTEARTLGFLGEESLEALRKSIDRATELGVLGTSANAEEFVSYGDDIARSMRGMAATSGAGAGAGAGAGVGRRARAALSAAGSAARSVNEVAIRSYRTGDDFWKFYNWTEEVRERSWAYRGAKPLAEVEAEAAEIVQQQLQTYSRTSPLAHTLSRHPIVGAFATFQFEMPRNLKNIALQGARDIREGVATSNPRLTILGAKRFAGLAAAVTVWGAQKKWREAELGISPEQEEAFRSLALPSWSDNSQPFFLDRKGTQWSYVDSQYQDPYSIVARSWNALLARPGTAPERLERFAGELADAFAGEEPLAVALGEIAFNKKRETGTPVYPEAAPTSRQLRDASYHLYRGAAPGGAITAERMARGAGLLNQQRGGGRVYELGDESLALAGIRVINVDVADSFRYKVLDWNRARTEIASTFNRDMKRAETPAERLAAKRTAEAAWKEHYLEMQGYAEDARVLGVPRRRVLGTLEGAEVSEKLREALMEGRYVSFRGRYTRQPKVGERERRGY